MSRMALFCLVLVCASTAAVLAARPAWPADETRYLGVAWGMWTRGDFLLPRLNGELYSDKPPMLFWLMHAGWSVFGVNAWWPRLISPLAALASLWLTGRIAHRLFPAPSDGVGSSRARAPDITRPQQPGPQQDSVAALAPLMLCGSLLFIVFSTILIFDMLLVCATSLALLGLLAARQDGGACGWWLFGFALGAGFLIKGPVVLVHVLPVALSVHWWCPTTSTAQSAAAEPVNARAPGPFRGAFFAKLSLSLLLGVALALAWVVPAGLAGGPEYRAELLWGQTVSRVTPGAAALHAEPWWYYVAVLPALLFPWSLWPRLWRALRALPSTTEADRLAAGGVDGIRFCVAWALPALVLLSAIATKQEQYLLPELPAFALLGAALLARASRAAGGSPGIATDTDPVVAPRVDAMLPCLVLVVVGAALVFGARQWPPLDIPDLIGTSALSGLALIGVGLVAVMARPRTRGATVALLSLLGAALLIAGHLGAPPEHLQKRDLRAAAIRVAALQRDGRPLAVIGKYRAQFDFFGELTEPIDSVLGRAVVAWFDEHANGVVISLRAEPGAAPPAPGLRLLEILTSGEQLWERIPQDSGAVRSPGLR